MAQSELDVTRQEFELMKIDHERLSIAVDSLTRAVTDGFEAVDLRLDALTTALTEFKATADAHHAAVLSALLAPGRNR